MNKKVYLLLVCAFLVSCKGNQNLDTEFNSGVAEYNDKLGADTVLYLSGDYDVSSSNLTKFEYIDYSGVKYTELFPKSGKWSKAKLNEEELSVNNKNIRLSLDYAKEHSTSYLYYGLINGSLVLNFTPVKDAVSYIIYKNGFRMAETSELSFADFSLNSLNGLVYNGSEIVSEQNNGLELNTEFTVVPVFSDGSLGEPSNKLNISNIANSLPVKLDDKRLTTGGKVNNPKDLPREVKVLTVGGNHKTYNIDYKLDETTRFTSKVYYRYYINNTNLKGFVEIDLNDSFNIPSTIENGEVSLAFEYKDIVSIVDKPVNKHEKVLNLNTYLKTANKERLSDILSVYKDLDDKIKNKDASISLADYAVGRSDYTEIVYGLADKYYAILDKLELNFNTMTINIAYADTEKLVFKDIEDAYKYVQENPNLDDKYIASLVATSLDNTDVVKTISNGRIKYINTVTVGENSYNIDFTAQDKRVFMCSDSMLDLLGYYKLKSPFYGHCLDDSKEYYKVNGLLANTPEEYAEILERELRNGNYSVKIKYLGDTISSSDIITIISNVFENLNKRDMLSRVKFADNNKIYTVMLGE